MSGETGSFESLSLDVLGEADGLHRLIVERSHDLITVLDLQGRIVHASSSYASLLGYEPGELVGSELLGIVHPDDTEAATRSISDVAAGDTLEGILVRLRHRDGRWVTVESTGSAILGADGVPVLLLGTARDVTEREELRSRLDELSAVYRLADAVARAGSLGELLDETVAALLDALSADRAAVLLTDNDSVMRFFAWRGLSAASREAFEAHSPWQADEPNAQPVLVADTAAAGFDPPVSEALRREGIRALAFVPLVHRSRLVGTIVLYHDRPHEFADGEIRLCRTMASHLASSTVRSRAQEALQASSDQLRIILRTVDDGITVQAQDGRLLYANDAAARIIGLEDAAALLATPVGELMGGFEILDEERRPIGAAELPGRIALTGQSAERTLCYRSRAGGPERWSIVRASPVAGSDGSVQLAVNVFRDITESRLADERALFLARATELLSASLDYEETLQALAALTVPTLAGQCIVDLVGDDGSIRAVAIAHVDSSKTELLRELRARYPPTAPGHPVQAALAEGATQFLSDLDARAVAAMAHDEKHAEAIRALGNTSGLVVPLRARGRTLGAITLGTVPPQPRFGASDVTLAEEVARRAAVAIDNARLYREAEEAGTVLSIVTDNAASALFMVDEHGHPTYMNASAEAMTGHHLHEIAGRPLHDAVHHTRPDGSRYPIEECPLDRAMPRLRTLEPYEDIFVRKDGSFFPGLAAASPIVRDGVPIGRVIEVRDLSAQKRLEAERDARVHAAEALEFIDDGVFLVDQGDIVRLWNPAAEAITGIGTAAALGRSVRDLLPGWEALLGRIPVAPQPSPGGSRAETLPLELKGFELWLAISGVRFPGGTVYAFRDVTEEHVVERLKTDFVSTISHELRTPLAAIYGAALTLRRTDVQLEETQRGGLLDVVANEADRLARIVNDILWASRLESGAMRVAIESCDPLELAQQIFDAAGSYAPAQITLALDARAEVARVAADPDKIRQVLTNLMENAVKYSPDGGRVELGIERQGERVRFRVSDEGLGIPPAEQGRIWEKFYRLDPQLTRGVGGTGLGLYISRELVHRMGGRIWVESDGRRGSTFLVELPIAEW